MKTESMENHTAAGSAIIKAVNYIAAALGIGTFVGLVNVAVGVLSATWLALQIYGYIKYELPIKHYRRAKAKREAERGATSPAPLDRTEAGE